MEHFSRHQLISENDGVQLLLFLDESETEFAAELGTLTEKSSRSLEERVQEYIKTKIPKNILVKSVQVMLGGIVLATISIPGIQSPPTVAASTVSPTENTIYTVKAGDTLFSIARQYQLTVTELKQMNNLTSDMLQIGQVLKISNIQVPEASPSLTYTVVSGDSLWGIAKKFGTTVDTIRSANHLTSDILKIGQSLVIPGISTPTPTPNPTSPVPLPVTTTYTVKAGDTLWALAKQYNTTVDALIAKNQLSSTALKIGQVLTIPTGQTETAPTPDPTITLLQRQLQELGYFTVPTMTGSLDASTVQAVKNFQTAYGLSSTGVIDPTTQTSIEHALVKKALVQDTNHYLGVPYVWGGTSPNGFDCSGFVYYMFNQHGVSMARSTSANLYTMGSPIARSKLQPGDLVFFAVNSPGVISHVGFYVGDNQFVSATSSKGIQVVSLDNTYWAKYYVGAKRVY